MRQIEIFVESVYHNVSGDRKEIEDLKVEMKSHLLESVYELKSEGKSEQEAIEMAIARFGGEDEMRSVVAQLLKAQKIFAKWVLFSAFAFLIIGAVIFAALFEMSNRNVEKDQQIALSLLERLGKNEVVSMNMKNEINSIARDNKHIQEIRIYNLQYNESIFSRFSEPDYLYDRGIWVPEVQAESFDNKNEKGNSNYWYIQMETRIFESLAVNVLIAGVVAYWVLFSIWLIVNAYQGRRLNTGWIIVFAIFNVLGYLAYLLFEKINQT